MGMYIFVECFVGWNAWMWMCEINSELPPMFVNIREMCVWYIVVIELRYDTKLHKAHKNQEC